MFIEIFFSLWPQCRRAPRAWTPNPFRAGTHLLAGTPRSCISSGRGEGIPAREGVRFVAFSDWLVWAWEYHKRGTLSSRDHLPLLKRAKHVLGSLSRCPLRVFCTGATPVLQRCALGLHRCETFLEDICSGTPKHSLHPSLTTFWTFLAFDQFPRQAASTSREEPEGFPINFVQEKSALFGQKLKGSFSGV